MGCLAFSLMVILTIVNLVIFHSIFSVLYLDLKNGILKEVVGAWIVATIEMAILLLLWEKLKPLFFGLLVVIFLIACLAGIIWIVAKLVKKNKKNDDSTNTTDTKKDE